MMFMESSALTGENVMDAFMTAVKTVLARVDEGVFGISEKLNSFAIYDACAYVVC